MRWILLATGFLLIGLPVWARDAPTPDSRLGPEEVVAIQLMALQANDSPSTDAGIEQTWAFAHPNNRRVTGPLSRFARMIKGPSYRMLLNHQSHEVTERSRTEDLAVFEVIVTTPSNETFGFRWAVRKVVEGEHAGAWMTVSVSPPLALGQRI